MLSPHGSNTTMMTPSPGPYHPNPQSPYLHKQRASNSNSNGMASANDISHQTISSQKSSQLHSALNIMMQPIPSPNTTPHSHTNDMSGLSGNR